MIVADTSYLVEAILRNSELFKEETLIAPDLAYYEVLNVIWKHETLIQDLPDAAAYLSIMEELISSDTIRLVRPDGRLVRDAYDLSIRYRTPLHDTVFVALALRLELELRTFDKAQARILSEESANLKTRDKIP
jgi:predicted nucleic acid-binding protein